MANSPTNAPAQAPAHDEMAAHIDMPAERRALAKAHVAVLAQTACKVALELPMSADVDDFRRILAAEAKP
jgi:hypothetical protein